MWKNSSFLNKHFFQQIIMENNIPNLLEYGNMEQSENGDIGKANEKKMSVG